jgi:hypothetical protein
MGMSPEEETRMNIELDASEILAIREALLCHKHAIGKADGYDHPAVAEKQKLVDRFNQLLEQARK